MIFSPGCSAHILHWPWHVFSHLLGAARWPLLLDRKKDMSLTYTTHRLLRRKGEVGQRRMKEENSAVQGSKDDSSYNAGKSDNDENEE